MMSTMKAGLFTAFVAFALGTVGVASAEDQPNRHNMLVFGDETVFLSHLPMFDVVTSDGATFASPHRYQVILEAGLTEAQLKLYRDDRKANPNVAFYTLSPAEEFVITRLFEPASAPKMTSFKATVYRGHFELDDPPVRVRGLENISIKVARVVHARAFDPRKPKPERLEYLLICRGSERLLAHVISAPPDFDHVLKIAALNRTLTDRDCAQDIRVQLTARANVAAERLRPGQSAQAVLFVGKAAPAEINLEVGTDIYFEEGELLSPATFEPTSEEGRK